MRFLTLVSLLCIVHVHALENLALHKPTWEQYPWPDTNRDFGSENAVDGMYTDRGTGGQCTISDDGKYNATWRVDIGRVVSIHHIDIYFRKDHKKRIAGFFVYVSNTTSKDDGYLCYHDESFNLMMVSEEQHINCTLQGRYVIYYNERKQGVVYPSFYSEYAYHELCEVEVYGCYGTYGDDCIYPCSTNCQDRRCDTNTGHCLSCVPGYKGQRCNQVCNNNSYGSECVLNCGNCSNGETCHHINGTCLNGCAEGALGDTCHEECQSGQYGLNCSQRCSQNCNVTSQCDRFTGQCDRGCKPEWTGNTCNQIKSPATLPSLCKDSYKNILIVIVVISVLSVVTGSLINFVIWKRNVAKFSRMSQRNMSQPQNKTGTMKENTDQQYTELEEIDNCKEYEEIHSYTNSSHQ